MSTLTPDPTSIPDDAPHNHITSLLIQESQQSSISEHGTHLQPVHGPQIIDPEFHYGHEPSDLDRAHGHEPSYLVLYANGHELSHPFDALPAVSNWYHPLGNPVDVDQLGVNPIQVDADYAGSQREPTSPARAENPSNKRKRTQSTDDGEGDPSGGSQCMPAQSASIVQSTNANKRKKQNPIEEKEEGESSVEDYPESQYRSAMSNGGHPPFRWSRACAPCKRLKMKCLFPEGENICQRCRNSGRANLCIPVPQEPKRPSDTNELLLQKLYTNMPPQVRASLITASVPSTAVDQLPRQDDLVRNAILRWISRSEVPNGDAAGSTPANNIPAGNEEENDPNDMSMAIVSAWVVSCATHVKSTPFAKVKEDDSSDEEHPEYSYQQAMSLGSSAPSRLPGACAPCKRLKMKCLFPEGENVCQRCKNSGRANLCVTRPRKSRGTELLIRSRGSRPPATVGHPNGKVNIELRVGEATDGCRPNGKLRIEPRLEKATEGGWATLVGPTLSAFSTAQEPVPIQQTQDTEWEQVSNNILDSEQTRNEGPNADGDAALNGFFQTLYKDADPDSQREMMKSFVESGETTLSTNWDEVKKEEVTVKPPEGPEWKKWGV